MSGVLAISESRKWIWVSMHMYVVYLVTFPQNDIQAIVPLPVLEILLEIAQFADKGE